MTIFESVKTAVPLKDAAERYGIKVTRGDMICCLFHNDLHPSMKLNQSYFYCFGCGEYGDVIDFVGKLLSINPIDAAKRMAADFGIDTDCTVTKPQICRRVESYGESERECFGVLCGYLHLLEEWKKAYAPTSPEDDYDDRFVEACKMLDYIEYLVDFFIYEDIEDRIRAVNVLITDGTIGKLQTQIERCEVSNMQDNESVAWFDGKKINEAMFCEEFIKDFPMVCLNNTFFTVDGTVGDESGIKQEIYNRIKPYIVTGLSKRVTSIVDVLKLECAVKSMPIYLDRIHVANGTYFLNQGFTEEKMFCRNRLPVAYNPNAPIPQTWLRFLSELLNDEDIPTLQEFIGYCLIPSTKGQKMLILTGKGGEGKSRIGLVLRALLGDNMNTGSIAKIETSPFARADLENELVLLDDDLKLEALPQTNHIKAIITAELPMDLEKKGKQSYQGDLYVRFLALGNGTLQSLYDRSVGFFRRQIILTAKEKAPDRKDDPFIAEKMCREAEGIFLWALEGLHRLIQNDYQFTISDAAMKNMESAVADGNNIIEFLSSQGYIGFSEDAYVSSKDLYGVYKLWCEDNALSPLSQRSFCAYLKQNESVYNISYTNKISIGRGKYVRGFKGIETLQLPLLKN